MRIHLSFLVVTTVGVLAASDTAGAQQDAVIQSPMEGSGSFSTGDYATREMREDAEPMTWLEEPIIEGHRAADDEDTGVPGLAPSGTPRPWADERASRDFPAEWEAEEEDADAFESDSAPEDDIPEEGEEEERVEEFSSAAPVAFDAYPLRHKFFRTSFPWRAVGKLYFRAASTGGVSYCSASVISGNNVIVTAAHCCYDTEVQQWNDRFQFVPATSKGREPFGVFKWKDGQAWVPSAYIQTGLAGGRQNDVCVIKLGRNQARRPVTYYTGWLSYSWNVAPEQHHFAFGYPGNLGDGEILQSCASESFADSGCGGSDVLHTGCNMTYGSSGGPWLLRHRPLKENGSFNIVNSVVSGPSCDGPEVPVFTGARFTDSNIGALCSAAGC